MGIESLSRWPVGQRQAFRSRTKMNAGEGKQYAIRALIGTRSRFAELVNASFADAHD